MFIETLRVKNFGVIGTREFNFSGGLNAIVGSNEKGKSSLIEALMYGLFGSQALRGSVDDVVTDGEKTMSVEVCFGKYMVKRTKTSASVKFDDEVVTGQAAVTNFFYDLLGVSKSSVEKVIWSDQGDTAGVVTRGSAEITNLIEDLAGFDQIDSLIEKAKNKFPSGNHTVYEELLNEDRERLSNLPEEESTESLEEDRAVEKKRLSELSTIILEKNSELEEKKLFLEKLKGQSKQKDNFEDSLSRTVREIDQLNEEIKHLRETAELDLPDIAAYTAYINDFQKLSEEYSLYKEITSFNNEHENEWVGDIESLKKEIAAVTDRTQQYITDIAKIEADISTQKNRLNNKEVCSECGQSVVELYAEINKDATEKIVSLKAALKLNRDSLTEAREDLRALKDILSKQKEREKFSDFAKDKNILPWSIEWHDKVPEKPNRTKFMEAQEEIKEHTILNDRIKKAKYDLPKKESELEGKEEIKKQTLKKIQEFTDNSSEISATIEQISQIGKSLQEIRDKRESAKDKISVLDNKIASINAANKANAKQKEDLLSRIASTKKKLVDDLRNSKILSSMRKAKPKVLDKVWSDVLLSVSHTFSEMRGRQCIVSKTEKGFYIDGIPARRLSGSAKSILGIAIKKVLRQTFCQEAFFMVFDEPAADCDPDRTATVISTIKTISGQTFMITHEEMSSSTVDTVIEL